MKRAADLALAVAMGLLMLPLVVLLRGDERNTGDPYGLGGG